MKIMIYTDPPMPIHRPPSAYAKIAWNLYEQMKDVHEFGYTSIDRANHMGIFTHGKCWIYESGYENFAEDIIEQNCNHFNADAILILKDPFAFANVFQKPLELMWYLAVDHDPVSPGIVTRMLTAYKIIVASEFGKKSLEKSKTGKIKVDAVIPHGYDPSIYFMRDEAGRAACRSQFHMEKKDKVVLFVGKNQIRKMASRAIQVMDYVWGMTHDRSIKFLLWTNVTGQVPLLPYILESPYKDLIAKPEPQMYESGIPEDDMGMLYNSADALFVVSGEGFYMPGLEGGACGLSCVVPDYGAAPERTDPDLVAKVSDWTYNNEIGVKQPLVDLEDMAKKILLVLDNQDKYREKALEKAKGMDWETIVKKHWLPFLDKCETEDLLPLIDNGVRKKWDLIPPGPPSGWGIREVVR